MPIKAALCLSFTLQSDVCEWCFQIHLLKGGSFSELMLNLSLRHACMSKLFWYLNWSESRSWSSMQRVVWGPKTTYTCNEQTLLSSRRYLVSSSQTFETKNICIFIDSRFFTFLKKNTTSLFKAEHFYVLKHVWRGSLEAGTIKSLACLIEKWLKGDIDNIQPTPPPFLCIHITTPRKPLL